MQGNQSAAQASIDWRDWIAFLGYVLATAVVVSVMLASVVLVISIQAESPVQSELAPVVPVVQSPASAALAAPADEARPQVAPQVDAAAAAPVAGGEPAAAQRVEAAPAPVPPIEITSETLRAETPVEPATSPR